MDNSDQLAEQKHFDETSYEIWKVEREMYQDFVFLL